MRSGGMFRAPVSDLRGLHRPLTYLRTLKEQFALKEALARADVVSEQSSAALVEVRKVYSGRVEKLTLGCDFEFWRPPRSEEKAAARRKLRVADGVKVFFASGNFVPRKQLDRLAEAFVKLGGGGFFLVIAGHGEARETARLTAIAAPLTAAGGALIHPYAEGEALRALYWAADLYVSVATDEGGPASVMKALACGVPVLTTPVGETADSLRECGAGGFVPVKEHGAWRAVLADIISGNLPAAMDLVAARARYDWPNVAARYIKIFEELECEYYGRADDA
jgi:glycosyltransferase involved in cell wall biosynthesis